MLESPRPSFDLTRHDLEALELELLKTRKRSRVWAAVDLATLIGISAALYIIAMIV